MFFKLLSKSLLLILIVSEIKESNSEVEVWPHPQSSTTSPNYLSIDSTKFKFVAKSAEKCDLLDKAIARYEDITFLQDCSRTGPKGKRPNIKTNQTLTDTNHKGVLNSITVEIKKCEQLPHLNMNENYTLSIKTNGAVLDSQTIWGAIRGLETFSQLVNHVGVNQFTINESTINDSPRFSHRGLLVDTSRHYIPVDILYQNLDAMAYNKLNVFHWHIVDDPSFPYVSKKFPDLSTKGAYNSETHIYTPTDVKDIIEYARERGIRVVVEFDSPGHTQSWGRGQPGILTECYSGGHPSGQHGPIDPSKDSVFTFIKELFTEVTQTYPDQYFHLGGDEVNFKCWESNPNIKKFMTDKHITTYAKLEDYYMRRVLDIVKGLNRSYVVWEEVFNDGVDLKPDTVVHVWKGSWGTEKEKYWRKELHKVTAKGFTALLSSCWYLDLISIGPDWEQYYSCEPHSFNGTEAQYKLVIGGEAAMWAEYVDGSNLISRVWFVLFQKFFFNI
jgi:hexosaminidase